MCNKNLLARMLLIALAAAICISCFGGVFAAGRDEFVILDGALRRYNGTGGAVTIPSSVTSIGFYAFGGCTSLTSVTIPSSVTSIGHSAFQNCISLTSATIPSSVTSIGFNVFRNCTSLTSVSIPSSVTYIGECAFQRCTALTSATIPGSVTYIGSYAFGDCTSLTSVSFSGSVTSIVPRTFDGCTSLSSVNNVYFPDVYVVGSDTEPFFSNCTNLTDVTFSNSTRIIPANAFRNCTSLTNIRIPENVGTIGTDSFSGASNLAYIYIPPTTTRIESFAIPRSTVIRGVAGSFAELYANSYGNPFQAVATDDSVYHFDAGKTIEVTAIPDPGWRFDGWTSTTPGVTFADPASAVTTFVMPASEVTVTATFVEDT